VISRVEALGFRSLRDLSFPLGPFHVVVGPNESGKTTFFDVLHFMRALVSDGVEEAVSARTHDLRDLFWKREGESFELAIEARIPESKRALLPEPQLDTIRYEVAVGLDSESQEPNIPAIVDEKVVLKEADKAQPEEREFFPFDSPPRKTLLSPKTGAVRTVVHKVPGRKDNYYSEVYRERGKGWLVAFQLGPRKSALSLLPGDETKFPVTTWFKALLTEKIRPFRLSRSGLRAASPPGQDRAMNTDGGNLPWVVTGLAESSPDRFRKWVEHVKTALPDLETITTREREDDRRRYVLLRYRGGLEVPSWGASDGTLRLLALTLPAYLEDFSGVCLFEEPENGIHPSAVRTLFDSLSSIPTAQVLMATHSPVVLSAAEPHQVICFAKTDGGATDVVAGHEHPALREWRGDLNLGHLFVEGVLD
jgi:predicted ATPase